MFEDSTKNRMQDSLDLFEEIINSKSVKNSFLEIINQLFNS